MTPLCLACHHAPAAVVVALLDADAHIDFATLASSSRFRDLTPLMFAVEGNNAGAAKVLLKRGAGGTKHTTQAAHGLAAGSTALDLARHCTGHNPDYAETLEVLRKRCCNTCGMTSRNQREQNAEFVGVNQEARPPQQKLQLCAGCPRHKGVRARYCSPKCQKADWVVRHRAKCEGAATNKC
jgi:hypothetical protein